MSVKSQVTESNHHVFATEFYTCLIIFNFIMYVLKLYISPHYFPFGKCIKVVLANEQQLPLNRSVD